MTMTNSGFRRIAAHRIYTPRGFLPQGVVTIDADGTILDVSAADGIDSMPGVEFYSGILIPGMVNAHCHLELSYLKGCIEPGGGFAAFARGMQQHRERFSVEQRVEAAEYADARLWADGVAAVADISNDASTFPVKSRSKIYYHTFAEVFGLRGNSTFGGQVLVRHAAEDGLCATITPHSTYSLNEALFREAVGPDSNTPLSIHFMESPGEEELFEGRGEMHQWYERAGMQTDFTGKYSSPSQRIVENIPSSRKIMLVHNTCIKDRDIDILASHFGDNLIFVLCPLSNRYITGEQPPVGLLRNRGVRIAVGTDSLASNTSLSMTAEIKALMEMSGNRVGGGPSLEEVLRWATVSAAEALGIDDTLGSIEPGKRPGLVLLKGVDMDTMMPYIDFSAKRIV